MSPPTNILCYALIDSCRIFMLENVWRDGLNSGGQQSIPTKRSAISHLKPANTNRHYNTWSWISMPWLGTGTQILRGETV
jgi:hypothetical protein